VNCPLSSLVSCGIGQDVSAVVDNYNSVLTELLNKHAPVLTKNVSIHPNAPWYTPQLMLAKKERRKAEHVWRRSKLTVHREIFADKRQTVNDLLIKAKTDYYADKIKNSSDQKALFSVVDKLLHRTKK
jgi:hypothetical protein